MTAKVGILTIGMDRITVENTIDKLTQFGNYAGKYSNVERLLNDAKAGRLTHVLISHEDAIDQKARKELSDSKVLVINIRDLNRII